MSISSGAHDDPTGIGGGDHDVKHRGASDADGHGGDHTHDHPHPPHEGSTFLKTVGMLVLASLLVAVILGGWTFITSTSKHIHDLETDVKQLKEKSAEKVTVDNIQEKIVDIPKYAAIAALLENELNTQRKEIDALRQSTNNIFTAYNNTIGKFETSINTHDKEVAILRSQVDQLNKAMARQEALLEKSAPEGKELKQLQESLAAVKERMVKLETLLSFRNNKEGVKP